MPVACSQANLGARSVAGTLGQRRFEVRDGSHCGSRSSLRANGSRECAPDDRLREAIHAATQRKNGLLRRSTPRNDGIARLPPLDLAYSAANTAFAISAVPLLPPNSIGLMPAA